MDAVGRDPRPGHQPVRLQAVALLVLGVLLLLNNSFSVLFAAAAGLWGYLFYRTAVKRQASYLLTAVIFAGIAGLSLIAFRRYLLVYNMMGASPGVMVLADAVFSLVAVIFLGAALYLSRKEESRSYITFLPYAVVLLMTLSIYGLLTSILQTGPGTVMNRCSPGMSISPLCRLCPLLGLGSGADSACFYKSWSTLSILVTGAGTGYLYGHHLSRARTVIATVVPAVIGLILLILFITLL